MTKREPATPTEQQDLLLIHPNSMTLLHNTTSYSYTLKLLPLRRL